MDTNVIKCTKCGANMKYSIKNNALKCIHCGEIKQIEESYDSTKSQELTNDILNQHPQWKESLVIKCNNCGAQVDLDKKEIVKNCPFCGSSNILKTDEICGIQPDSVIPFAVTKQSAVACFKKWISKKAYAPRKCKKSADIENINAVYYPTWLFSSNTNSYYDGMLGEDYEETTTDSEGNSVTTTHTRWYRVSGNISAAYRDILIPSGKLIPKNITNKLCPYPISSAKTYKQEYLIGRSAEHYSRDIKVCFGEFESHVYTDLCMRIKQQYGADHIGKMNINTSYNNKSFNYMLFPAYIAHFKHKNKNYDFYINGATGKLVGQYPKSGWKIFFTIFAAVAAAAVVVVGAVILRLLF